MGQRAPKLEVQAKAVTQVSSVFTAYEDRMMPRKEELLWIYEEYSTFRERKNSNWSTAFKINKAHEIIEKVVPSMTAKNPRWVVSLRDVKAFKDSPDMLKLKEAMATEQGVVDADNEVLGPKREAVKEHAEVVQDYLTYIFERYGILDAVELWAKNGVADGVANAEIVYKQEKAIVPKKVPELDEFDQQVVDADGKLQYVDSSESTVTGEYPTIENISWADAYYDPRYISLEDRPAFIRQKDNVRLSSLLRYKDRYMNLDKLQEMINFSHSTVTNDQEGFKLRMLQITGIQDMDQVTKIDENSLALRYYYGYFSPTEDAKDEKLFKICTVDHKIVIQMQEITQMPIEEWKCFPNGKDGNAVGFVEPILGLQEEQNFKKNSASEYINKSIQRQRIWSPDSGIDPETINDVIIPTDKNGQVALQNFPEVTFGTLGSDYFAEQNDFERQIQSATHTIDTSNPRNQQGLTNTATGAKIKFFESNKVLDAVRRRFERALERLAYKLIHCAFENMEDNIVFKKTDSEEYWHVNKEVLRDAVNKYEIKVEVNSSSFSDIQDRRDDSLAWLNILQGIDAQLERTGSPQRVNFIPVLKDIGQTFEKKDPAKFLHAPQVGMQPEAPGGAGPISNAKPTERIKSPAEKLTKSVAGNL